MKLHGKLLSVCDLSSADRVDMIQLMNSHYENVQQWMFESDLAEKQWVITLRSELDGKLCGFSTQMVLDATIAERPIKALFSGDTIIDRRYWGGSTLVQFGTHLALSLVDRFPGDELYWFLISGGYKTYRFMPVLFREFFPRHDAPMPADMKSVLDAFARKKFPQHYDEEAGIVKSDPNQYRLRQGVADVTQERLRDAHVRFFVERNPGHHRGDELCCIAPLTRQNFTDTAYRTQASML